MNILFQFANEFWLVGTALSVLTTVLMMIFLIVSILFKEIKQKTLGKVFYVLWLVSIPINSTICWLTFFSYILKFIDFIVN